MRPLLSYHRVQTLVSDIIRGRRAFFPRKASQLNYLNVGCGRWPDPAFINLDWHWMPGVDVCWDLRKPYPFADNRLQGLYSEHCIDGLPPEYFRPNLREMYRVLKPGGTLRLIFCDSELYIAAYARHRTDPSVPIPNMQERGHATALEALDWIFHHPTHRTLVDFETLSLHLREAGFGEITRRKFREGADPQLLVDRPERANESLYVEAVK